MLASAITCLIVGITDGDSITARFGEPSAYEQVKVRIAAIDAPERRQDYGNRARQALASLCHQQQARITHRDTDRWGRMVGDGVCALREAAPAPIPAARGGQGRAPGPVGDAQRGPRTGAAVEVAQVTKGAGQTAWPSDSHRIDCRGILLIHTVLLCVESKFFGGGCVAATAC